MKGTWITHLKMQEGLLLEEQRNPPCVAADRVVLAPGTMQLNIFAWNKELTKYVKDGQPKKVIQLFQQMQQERMCTNEFTFVEVIKACAGLVAPEDGRNVHEHIIQSGCQSNIFVGCSLVDMYMQNVGAWRMLGECSTRCHLQIGHLDSHDIGTCEMGARPEGTGTISTKATTETNIPKVVH